MTLHYENHPKIKHQYFTQTKSKVLSFGLNTLRNQTNIVLFYIMKLQQTDIPNKILDQDNH